MNDSSSNPDMDHDRRTVLAAMADAGTQPGWSYLKRVTCFAVLKSPESRVNAIFGIVVADQYGRLWIDYDDRTVCVTDKPAWDVLGNKSPQLVTIEELVEQWNKTHG